VDVPETADIAVIGSANVDLVLDVDHRPAAGETLLGSDVVTTPGGKGANQAVAAARAGGRVAFVGCVGADGHGELVRDSLRDAEVRVGGLLTVEAPTGNAVIVVTPDGENSIIVAPGANRSVGPALLESTQEHWSGARILVTQLEIPLETVVAVARHARRSGARLVLNAAPVAALPQEVLAVCDPLVVNESEARALLAGHDGPGSEPATSPAGDGGDHVRPDGEALAAALLRRGPRSVIVTLGPDGAVVVDGLRTTRVSAPRVRPVDTTGAGDAFVGALAAQLAAGQPLVVAARVAASYAAATVTRRGAQTSYGTLADLHAEVAQGG
jgi:ribokinase